MPNGVADPDLGDIAHEDRCPRDGLHHDAFDILKAANESDTSHDVLLSVLFQDLAAGVGVVAGDGLKHVVESEIIFAQHRRLDQDLVLLAVAAH